jgi:hypothetical protein
MQLHDTRGDSQMELNEKHEEMCTLSKWDVGCRFDFPNPEYR